MHTDKGTFELDLSLDSSDSLLENDGDVGPLIVADRIKKDWAILMQIHAVMMVGTRPSKRSLCGVSFLMCRRKVDSRRKKDPTR